MNRRALVLSLLTLPEAAAAIVITRADPGMVIGIDGGGLDDRMAVAVVMRPKLRHRIGAEFIFLAFRLMMIVPLPRRLL